MPPLRRDPSGRRSATGLYRDDTMQRSPSRAMAHYYSYKDRNREAPPYFDDGSGPTQEIRQQYEPDHSHPEAGRFQPATTAHEEYYTPPAISRPHEMSGAFPQTLRQIINTGNVVDEKQATAATTASHDFFVPATPTKASTGPLEIEIPPMSSQPASTVNSFFIAFFTAILSISTLGASLTFNYILNGSLRTPPPEALFTKSHLQTFVAMAWLLFILALASTAAFQTLLKFYGTQLQSAWERGGRRQRLAQWVGMAVSAFLYVLVISAFVFLSLIVVAFTPAVGWTAVAFTSTFGIFGLASIAYQAPIWSAKRRGKR